jgi:hypothetical protein
MAQTRLLALAIAVIVLFPSSLSAQPQTSRVYAAGVLFGDVREFGDVNQGGAFGFGDLGSSDATSIGGSFRAGTWLHPRWTLELGLDIATRTTTERESDVIIAIFPPPPLLNFKASSDFTTVTTMVGFHQPVSGRIQLGYRAGFAFVRSTSTLDVRVPGFPRILAQAGTLYGIAPDGTLILSNSANSSSVSNVDLQAPAVSQTTNSGAVALGIEAAIALTPHLAVVPELRAMVVTSPSDVFLIRPAVGVRWNF